MALCSLYRQDDIQGNNNRRKFRSLTSDNMDSWKAEWQSGQVSRKEINTRVESLDRRYRRDKCYECRSGKCLAVLSWMCSTSQLDAASSRCTGARAMGVCGGPHGGTKFTRHTNGKGFWASNRSFWLPIWTARQPRRSEMYLTVNAEPNKW